jgi:hypothetical protein
MGQYVINTELIVDILMALGLTFAFLKLFLLDNPERSPWINEIKFFDPTLVKVEKGGKITKARK